MQQHNDEAEAKDTSSHGENIQDIIFKFMDNRTQAQMGSLLNYSKVADKN